MKKVLSFIVVVMLTFSVLLTGCADGTKSSGASGKKLKIVLLTNGNLGDKSFFDSANEGLKQIKSKFGAETKVVEMGPDQTKWEPTLADVSDEDWDIIVVGTWEMAEPLQKIAPQHKDKKYIIFDTSVDYSKGNLSNVYSIQYLQNEGSFLAGALAAKITESSMPLANKDKIIGFVGGQDIPVINDYVVGYIQGAQYVDKDIKVSISYIGDFFNTGKGKEMALAQYNQKADVVFTAASQGSLGVLDAAKEQNKYAIGVDSDQAMLFKSSDPTKANLITSSVLKRVDNSLVRAVTLDRQGKLKWGSADSLGLKEDAIGLADNEIYQKVIPQDIRNYITDLKKKVVSGQIKVQTAIGMDTGKLNEIKNSVRP